MAYTFECGTCHSVYRLDESQITSSGVKVTCPKCLSYFFLRPGTQEEATEIPIVEHMVPDGPHEIVSSASEAGEGVTADQLLSDLDFEDEKKKVSSFKTEDPAKIPKPSKPDPVPEREVSPPPVSKPVVPIKSEPSEKPREPAPRVVVERVRQIPSSRESRAMDRVTPTPRGLYEESNTQVTLAELSDFPPDQEPQTRFDRYLLGVSLGVILVSGLLLMNYLGTIKIPGLGMLRAPENHEISQEEALPSNTKAPKHGFPAVDPGYDPWDGKPPPSQPTPKP